MGENLCLKGYLPRFSPNRQKPQVPEAGQVPKNLHLRTPESNPETKTKVAVIRHHQTPTGGHKAHPLPFLLMANLPMIKPLPLALPCMGKGT